MKLILIFTQIIATRSFGDTFRSWVVNDFIPRHTKVDEWWDNPMIHTFGNSGIGGMLHAEVADYVTDMIDDYAYEGVNIRRSISDHIVSRMPQKRSVTAVDLGCGVGKSTRSISDALDGEFENYQVYGVDTSKEMINKARRIEETDSQGKHAIYVNENAAKYPLRHLHGTVDVATIFYLMHEAPRQGQYFVLDSAWKLVRDQGMVVVVDISPDYEPSTSMLLGEPYMLGYMDTFEQTIDHVIESGKFRQYRGDDLFTEWVPGHVTVTILRKDNGI